MNLSAANPNYEADLRRVLGSSPVVRYLGIEIGEIQVGSVTLSLCSRPELCQAKGIIQAGITGTLADFAGGSASATLLPPGWVLVTADYTVKLLSPASGERLVARAQVVQFSRTLSVARADVFSVGREGRERLCAAALVSTMAMEAPGRAKDRG